MNSFSNYIVYVDESGDHGMNVDERYPILVLAFCIFEKQTYASAVIPAWQNFKFQYFGHDTTILHERDIHKQKGDFSFLQSYDLQQEFMGSLNQLMAGIDFKIISIVIDKRKFCQCDIKLNPYFKAFHLGLERVFFYLKKKQQVNEKTFFISEARGKKEDNELMLSFNSFVAGANIMNRALPFEIKVVDKKVNSCGLQIADLIARPIGQKYLHPTSENRAFDVIRSKFDCSSEGQIKGYGIKIFP